MWFRYNAASKSRNFFYHCECGRNGKVRLTLCRLNLPTHLQRSKNYLTHVSVRPMRKWIKKYYMLPRYASLVRNRKRKMSRFEGLTMPFQQKDLCLIFSSSCSLHLLILGFHELVKRTSRSIFLLPSEKQILSNVHLTSTDNNIFN